MNADDFRNLALALPETAESAHQGHADFRVRNKVFATLGPDEVWAMVKLTPERQSMCVVAEPDVFEAFGGAWGRQGCTKVWLEGARESSVREALVTAWRKTAPKRLGEQYDGE